MTEDIVLIIDALVLPHLSFRGVDMGDPEALETEISVITATIPATIIAEGRCYSEIGELCASPMVLPPAPGTFFRDAFRAYLQDIRPTPPGGRRRSLVFVVSASANRDAGLLELMHELQAGGKRRTMGLVYLDIGGHLDAIVQHDWLELADYLVFSRARGVKPEHLQSLWSWVPSCRRGFQMYHFEGHHPNERTWLATPPPQFGFRNLLLEQKMRAWGPLREGVNEPVAGEPAVGGDA